MDITVLAIDDEALIRTLCVDFLTPQGYKVITAREGKEGLEKLEKEKVDIILLDIMLPGETGLELLPKIKKMKPEVIVLMMTAFATLENAIEAIKKGAYDYIRKPADPDEFVHSVNKAAEKHVLELKNKELVEGLNQKVKEITALYQKLNIEKKKVEAIVMSMVEGVVVAGPKGKIVLMNSSAKKIFNINKTGNGFIIKEEDKSDLQQLEKLFQKSLSKKEVHTGKLKITSLEEKMFNTKIAPIKGAKDEILGAVAVLEDITDINRLNELKSDFISRVSHELRTPLTSIGGAVNLMLREKIGSINEEQKKLLNIVDKENTRLTSLINDLLDMSQLESGTKSIEGESINLDEILRDSIKSFQQLIEEKKISLESEMSSQLPLVEGDSKKIKQVILNLLDNAIRFTPQKGSVRITGREICISRDIKRSETISLASIASFEEKSSGSTEGRKYILTTITDTGTGIDPLNINIIFDKFHQAGDILTREVSGTGLGLPICKYIIESHGGRIWAESEVGKGSKFSFILPVE